MTWVFSTLGVVMLLLLFNLTYALSSSPLGTLSDRWERKRVITGGWVIYTLVYLGLGLASTGYEPWALLAAPFFFSLRCQRSALFFW
jgi:MFS family permease